MEKYLQTPFTIVSNESSLERFCWLYMGSKSYFKSWILTPRWPFLDVTIKMVTSAGYAAYWEHLPIIHHYSCPLQNCKETWASFQSMASSHRISLQLLQECSEVPYVWNRVGLTTRLGTIRSWAGFCLE